MEALYGKFGNREAKGRFKVRITVPQNFSEKKLVGYVISEANDVIGPQVSNSAVLLRLGKNWSPTYFELRNGAYQQGDFRTWVRK